MPATERERPYSQFNFTVSWTDLDETSHLAAFQEVSGLGMEISVAEYRGGNWGLNSPIKISGTYKVPDVTFKRGLMGALDLYTWLDAVRNGAQDQLKTITVKLMGEDRETIAMEWKLIDARPMKYTGPPLNGKGTDVAIEELAVSCEDIRQQ